MCPVAEIRLHCLGTGAEVAGFGLGVSFFAIWSSRFPVQVFLALGSMLSGFETLNPKPALGQFGGFR